MKKILKLSFVLFITVFMIGNVYAALSCNVSVKSSKTKVTKTEEFTVDVNVSNIESERGLIGFNAILEYDKESLELVRMEGKNGWENPEEGSSYNSANGKLVLTRSGLGKNDETVFTITFKVKENSKQNLMVTLKNIRVADGTSPAKVELAYQNITVTDGASNPVPTPGTDDDTNTTPSTNSSSNSSLVGNNSNAGKNTSTNTLNKNTINNGTLPKAGDTLPMVFVVLIVVAVLVAGIFFVKMKKINKEIEK